MALQRSLLRQLARPAPDSHKGENGILYIAAGSKQYHGALLYAVMAASFFVDLIFVETDPTNRPALTSLKKLHPAIIAVSGRKRSTYLQRGDCLLLGPGLGRSKKTERLVHALLRHPNRSRATVIDADALAYMPKRALTTSTILTPHPGEYKACFGRISPKALSRKIPAVILAKGLPARICQNGKCEYTTVGIARFTKGGMGDVLAGLTAAFACTNPPLLAAQAASLLLGLTVERLERHYMTSVSTLTVIQELPRTLTRYQRHRSSE